MDKTQILISLLREHSGMTQRFCSYEKLIENRELINTEEGWIGDWLRGSIPRSFKKGIKKEGLVLLYRRDYNRYYQVGGNNDQNRTTTPIGFWFDPDVYHYKGTYISHYLDAFTKFETAVKYQLFYT